MDNRINSKLLSALLDPESEPFDTFSVASSSNENPENSLTASASGSVSGSISTNPSGLQRSHSQGLIPEAFLPKARERTSWIWRHGGLYQGPDRYGVIRNRWRCHLCPNPETAVHYADTTTKNAIDHLVKYHEFYRNGSPSSPLASNFKNSVSDPPIPTLVYDQSNISSLPKLAFNKDVFKHLFIRWIIMHNIPFNQAVSPVLKLLLMYLCAVQASFTELTKALPKSSSTIATWVVNSFTANKERVKTLLSSAVSSIHMSFDLWTSPNNLALLGVVGHWLDSGGVIRHGLLGLRDLIGAHSGDNQGALVWSVITEFQVQRTLGYFTLDNASNNTTALQFIQTQINQNRTRPTDPTFNADQRYIRCYGHILNLVVKVFLYGKKSLRLKGSYEEKNTIEKENLAMESWRKIGPLGKLRNLTVWIQGSPQRRQAFSVTVKTILGKTTQARGLILGNVTRWTGDHDGLERALELQLAIDLHIQNLVSNDSKHSIAKDQLTPSDWIVLQTIFNFLVPFRNETLSLEGNQTQSLLFNIYPSFEFFRRHLLHSRTSLKGQSVVLYSAFDLAWTKLEKYYSLTSLSPIICASIILNPNMDGFFDDIKNGWGLRPEWTVKAKELVQILWETTYKNLVLHTEQISSSSSSKRDFNPSTSSTGTASDFARNFKKPKLSTHTNTDELDRFLRWLYQNDDILENPITWWIEARQLYPRLSILALDTFSIPAMSAECERVFSSAKQQITDRRNRLDSCTIEAGECQKSWAKAGLIAFDSAIEISDMLEKSEQDSLRLETIK